MFKEEGNGRVLRDRARYVKKDRGVRERRGLLPPASMGDHRPCSYYEHPVGLYIKL